MGSPHFAYHATKDGTVGERAGSLLRGGLGLLQRQLAGARRAEAQLRAELAGQQGELRRVALYKRSAEAALARLGRRGGEGGAAAE